MKIKNVKKSVFQITLNSFAESLSEKWLPSVTFTICNMQNQNGYSDIIDLL